MSPLACRGVTWDGRLTISAYMSALPAVLRAMNGPSGLVICPATCMTLLTARA